MYLIEFSVSKIIIVIKKKNFSHITILKFILYNPIFLSSRIKMKYIFIFDIVY